MLNLKSHVFLFQIILLLHYSGRLFANMCDTLALGESCTECDRSCSYQSFRVVQRSGIQHAVTSLDPSAHIVNLQSFTVKLTAETRDEPSLTVTIRNANRMDVILTKYTLTVDAAGYPQSKLITNMDITTNVVLIDFECTSPFAICLVDWSLQFVTKGFNATYTPTPAPTPSPSIPITQQPWFLPVVILIGCFVGIIALGLLICYVCRVYGQRRVKKYKGVSTPAFALPPSRPGYAVVTPQLSAPRVEEPPTARHEKIQIEMSDNTPEQQLRQQNQSPNQKLNHHAEHHVTTNSHVTFALPDTPQQGVSSPHNMMIEDYRTTKQQTEHIPQPPQPQPQPQPQPVLVEPEPDDDGTDCILATDIFDPLPKQQEASPRVAPIVTPSQQALTPQNEMNRIPLNTATEEKVVPEDEEGDDTDDSADGAILASDIFGADTSGGKQPPPPPPTSAEDQIEVNFDD